MPSLIFPGVRELRFKAHNGCDRRDGRRLRPESSVRADVFCPGGFVRERDDCLIVVCLGEPAIRSGIFLLQPRGISMLRLCSAHAPPSSLASPSPSNATDAAQPLVQKPMNSRALLLLALERASMPKLLELPRPFLFLRRGFESWRMLFREKWKRHRQMARTRNHQSCPTIQQR